MNLSLQYLVLFLLSINTAYASKESIFALNWKAEPQFGGFYQAQLDKIYEKNSLNIKIIEGGSGTPTLQMLLAKKVDYAILSADEIIVSHERGATDVVALFATYQINPQVLIAHAEAPAKNISELLKLKDHRLLWQSGLPYAQFLIKMYEPVHIQMSPYTGGISYFISDKKIVQQGFATSEPILIRKEKLNPKIFLISESGYNPYTTVLAVRKSDLSKKKTEFFSMYKSVQEGWKRYLSNPQKVNELILKLNPSMDKSFLDASAKAQVPLIQPNQKLELGHMSTQRWEELISQLQNIGLIQKKLLPKNLFVTPDKLTPAER